MQPDLMRRGHRAVGAWLFCAGSEARLSAVITGLSALIGIQLAFFPWADLAELPAALFRPVPFLFFLTGMPPAGVIVALQVAGVIAAGLATIGWRRPVTFALAWLPYLILGGLRASRGKIQHNDLLLLVGAMPFLFAPVTHWLTRASIRRSVRYGWPIQTAIAFVAGAYFLSGLRKLTGSGIAWVTSDNMRWVLYAGAERKAKAPGLALFIADRAWLAHLAAAGTLLFELGFVFLLLSRRTRPLLVVSAFAIHGATWLTLGLDYWKYPGVVALLLIDCTPWVLRLQRVPWPVWRRPPLPAVARSHRSLPVGGRSQ